MAISGQNAAMAMALCATLVLVTLSSLSSCSSHSVEKTVTLDAERPKTLPSVSPTTSPLQLPVTNSRVETIGDRTAEARLRLKQGQRAAAVRALEQAEAATRALLSEQLPDGISDSKLRATLKDMQQAQLLVERGKLDEATRRLAKVDQQLDSLRD